MSWMNRSKGRGELGAAEEEGGGGRTEEVPGFGALDGIGWEQLRLGEEVGKELDDDS